MWSFVTRVFHLVWCFQSLSMLRLVLVPHLLLWLNNIPLYRYTTFCQTIHQLMKIWVVSPLGLLWIILLWPFTYKFLCKHTSSILLGIGVEFLGHMVALCLTFWGTATYFWKWLHHFTFSSAMYEASNFSTSSPTFIITLFEKYSHSHGCEVLSHCGFDLHFPHG